MIHLKIVLSRRSKVSLLFEEQGLLNYLLGSSVFFEICLFEEELTVMCITSLQLLYFYLCGKVTLGGEGGTNLLRQSIL